MKLAEIAVLQQERNGLTAAAGPPLIPPREWFEAEEPEEPTGWTVTADGRVFGHAAVWGTCHTGKPGRCVTPPKSRSDYAYYKTGLTEVDDGELIPTGRITLGTGHASLTASPAAAAEHYDNTGAVVADVTVKDGKHGIWVTGALRPNVSPERIRELRGASLSGDWRSIRGKLEMLGLLAVNVPGFPVPRAMTASGEGDEVLALVAAGVLYEEKDVEVLQGDEMSEDEADEEIKALYAATRSKSDKHMRERDKVAEVMREFKAGKLKSSSGSNVTSREQALAIALSEARATTASADFDAAQLAAAGFDESKHKRHPKGDERGGQFAPKSGATEGLSPSPEGGFVDERGQHMANVEPGSKYDVPGFHEAVNTLHDRFAEHYADARNAGASHEEALSEAETTVQEDFDLQEFFAEDEIPGATGEDDDYDSLSELYDKVFEVADLESFGKNFPADGEYGFAEEDASSRDFAPSEPLPPAAKSRPRKNRRSSEPFMSSGEMEGGQLLAASFTQAMRDKLEKEGKAMEGGRYPIRNRTDLANAIRDLGRQGDDPGAKRWIIKRARELKAVDALPASWDVSVTAAGTFDEAKHPRHAKGSEKGGEFAPKKTITGPTGKQMSRTEAGVLLDKAEGRRVASHSAVPAERSDQMLSRRTEALSPLNAAEFQSMAAVEREALDTALAAGDVDGVRLAAERLVELMHGARHIRDEL